ncbi:SDR family NAD(P)-dependent oxidoreductase [Phycicoccus avicenniae]|uniref:SDR family NAD(P)-dependent oxidoreductase n=1 Tax=Phycicoccus avicenniae TaxID=2828860 RepID=UPI003D2CE116
MELTGAVAVVTAGGGGLGAHLVHALAREGCHVVVADRDADAAARVAEEVRDGGGRATDVRCDVLVDDDLRALVDLTRGLGGVDLLVANAGGWGGASEQYPGAEVGDWSAVLDLNLRAPMLLLQLCLPSMRARGTGAVVTVASSAGVEAGAYGSPPYAAAKAGLVRITTSLADLGAEGVRVTTVVPGWIGLDRAHREWDALPEDERAGLPALVPPSLVAAEVVALARDGAGGRVVTLLDGERREVLHP